MPRPTAARIFYMIIGLVLGVVVAFAIQLYLVPRITSSVPFLTGAPPATPVAAAGPSQFTGGTLERVVVLNQQQDRGGVVVRLNAIELFGDGFTITYTLTNGRGGVAPQTLEPEAFQVTDERGTPYTLSAVGSSAAYSAGHTTGMVSFTPVPPQGVGALRVSVPNALVLGRPRDAQSRVLPGPWEFNFQLARG